MDNLPNPDVRAEHIVENIESALGNFRSIIQQLEKQNAKSTKHPKSDTREVVMSFAKDRTPPTRYASFDYCYNHFHHFPNRPKIDIGKSCLTLGVYLASWGMYRGSSFLLQKSAKHLIDTVEYVASLPPNAWKIDVLTLLQSLAIKQPKAR